MSLLCLTKRRFQEFKEAFNMIDQNRDGFIDQADLQEMFASLGASEVLLLKSCSI
ncbi:EF hand [Cooperia oncophora]